MEEMKFPPEGGMGPIFSKYNNMSTRFYVRAGDKADDEGHWPVEKFQELLQQIREIVAPDKSIQSGMYI